MYLGRVNFINQPVTLHEEFARFGIFELGRSRLLRAAGQPFPAKFFGDLFVGECTPRFDICSPAGHGLDNVQVVEHVIQTAVVWESIQHGLHSFFGLHQLFLPGHIGASIPRTRVARSVWLTL